ncbi:response regulator [bacterium]|nr:response regulator [bacterium]
MPKPTIICVDDEKIVLDSLKRELKNVFADIYQIEVAESGEEALEIAEELIGNSIEVPLIIADFIMPKMKGDECLIKIHKLLPDTCKIMLTGRATTEGITNALNNANLYRYISKPWQSEDMSMTANEAIKSFYARKKLEERRIALEVANKKLMKLDSAKNYFLGLLSHELNTPLIGINGNAKLIQAISDDKDVLESVDGILDSENRLRRLADMSLLITRMRTDKYAIKKQAEPLSGLIDAAMFNHRDSAEAKNIKLTKIFEIEDQSILVDYSLILKVFDFVIDNAIKYSDDDSEVKIITEKSDTGIELLILDQGRGFSEDSIGSLFELFVSDELMSHSEGLGLSLAAAKIITEAHDFDIRAENNLEGGAMIRIQF